MPPRTRVSDVPQTRGSANTLPQRRASTESNSIHPKPLVNRSPRLLGDRRSPRGSQSDPLTQRKLGTRISGLETQLVQAQLELKNLKQHLASAESVKKTRINNLSTKRANGAPEETHKETDVFEVPMDKNVSVEPLSELELDNQDDDKSKIPSADELEKPCLDETDTKNKEIEELKAKMEAVSQENEMLKKELNEANSEMEHKCTQLQKDLEASNAAKFEVREKLEAVEAAKEELEEEIKKLRVQTEQWRKAADAAAAVLAESGGGRISKGYGFMEKQFNGVFESPLVGGYPMGSPELEEDSDDGFGSGKRKGSGIRMFGDLWKKKGQK